uniref:Uncharacterized protein n=1 Tax=Helianthus annuus TaxID=4232 RepID=A0A251TZ81_HELAN
MIRTVATVLDQVKETLSHDNSSDHGPKTPATVSSILIELHRSCKGFASAGFWRSND